VLCWSATNGGQFNRAACRAVRTDCRYFDSVGAGPNIDPDEAKCFSLDLMIVPSRADAVVADSQTVYFESDLPAFGNLCFNLQSGSHDYLIGRWRNDAHIAGRNRRFG